MSDSAKFVFIIICVFVVFFAIGYPIPYVWGVITETLDIVITGIGRIIREFFIIIT